MIAKHEVTNHYHTHTHNEDNRVTHVYEIHTHIYEYKPFKTRFKEVLDKWIPNFKKK